MANLRATGALGLGIAWTMAGPGWGCGSAAAPPRDAGVDDRSDAVDDRSDAVDGDGTDTAPDAPAFVCDTTKPFGAITAVTSLNGTGDDQSVFFSEDQLTAYLSSNRTGTTQASYDIWVATRASIDSDFNLATLVDATDVNTASPEEIPSISRDGLRLAFASTRSVGGPSRSNLFVATRATTADPFAAPELIAGINSDSNSAASQWFSADETVVYFQSDRPGGVGGTDLYVGDFGVAGATNIRNLTAVNSDRYEVRPVLSDDGLTLYFASDRTGQGQQYIYVVRRPTTADDFGQPENVAELNFMGAESPTWLSPDGCTLYFARRPTGGAYVPTHIFQATRGK